MKSKKNVIAISAASLVIFATSVTAFATTGYATPAGVLAEITGNTVESVIAQKAETGKTYGSIAVEAGKLDEFKTASLEAKKERLYAQVADGTITQEKADEIIKAIEENQANCDGTQSQSMGKNAGAKFGADGACFGTGCANGNSEKSKKTGNNCTGTGGKGLQDGSCCPVR
ncbi:MAG: hypothetical protein VB018_13805 [Lachnospiraceae bacterium]|nr:hypothetical protein [Lachnospiraceae bacterium]